MEIGYLATILKRYNIFIFIYLFIFLSELWFL